MLHCVVANYTFVPADGPATGHFAGPIGRAETRADALVVVQAYAGSFVNVAPGTGVTCTVSDLFHTDEHGPVYVGYITEREPL